VTHIISLCPGGIGERPLPISVTNHIKIEVVDDPSTNLLSKFPLCIDFMSQALAGGGRFGTACHSHLPFALVIHTDRFHLLAV
jgi:hypothetical protein